MDDPLTLPQASDWLLYPPPDYQEMPVPNAKDQQHQSPTSSNGFLSPMRLLSGKRSPLPFPSPTSHLRKALLRESLQPPLPQSLRTESHSCSEESFSTDNTSDKISNGVCSESTEIHHIVAPTGWVLRDTVSDPGSMDEEPIARRQLVRIDGLNAPIRRVYTNSSKIRDSSRISTPIWAQKHTQSESCVIPGTESEPDSKTHSVGGLLPRPYSRDFVVPSTRDTLILALEREIFEKVGLLDQRQILEIRYSALLDITLPQFAEKSPTVRIVRQDVDIQKPHSNRGLLATFSIRTIRRLWVWSLLLAVVVILRICLVFTILSREASGLPTEVNIPKVYGMRDRIDRYLTWVWLANLD